MNNGYRIEDILESENTNEEEKIENLHNCFRNLSFEDVFIIMKAIERLGKDIARVQ